MHNKVQNDGNNVMIM